MDGNTGESSSTDVRETAPLRGIQSSTSASWTSPETGHRPPSILPPTMTRYQAVCRTDVSGQGTVNGCSKESSMPIYGTADCTGDDEDDYDDEYDDVIDEEKKKRRRKAKTRKIEQFGLRVSVDEC